MPTKEHSKTSGFFIPCGPGEGATIAHQLTGMFHIVAGIEKNGGFTCVNPKKSIEETIIWLQMHYTSYSVDGAWWHRPSEDDDEETQSSIKISGKISLEAGAAMAGRISELGTENAALKEVVRDMYELLHTAEPVSANFFHSRAIKDTTEWYSNRIKIDTRIESLLGKEQ